jgi:Zn-dependent protease
MSPDVVTVILAIAFLLLSLGIHEAAHGWVAWKCGDSTAKDLGRITVNPIPHIDPVMSILVPAALYYISSGQFLFGGAKPVPVAFHRLRHPWRDMSLVALAGPASNFILAIVFYAAYRVAVIHFGMQPDGQVLTEALFHAVRVNLLLAAFNLVPIPPLDGSRIMAWILPENLRAPYVRLETVGMLIVVGLLASGLLFRVVAPVMRGMMVWVEEIVTLGGLW